MKYLLFCGLISLVNNIDLTYKDAGNYHNKGRMM